MRYSMLSAAFSLLLIYPVVAVDPNEVRFFYSPLRDACEWGPSNTFQASNNTNNGGLCSYAPSINRLYACPAPDPHCWTLYQTCKKGTNTAGDDQILCGSSTRTQWCCADSETCTITPGQVSVCISTFDSPNAGVAAAAAAAKQYSALPSQSIVTNLPSATPSVFSTRKLGGSSRSSEGSTRASGSTSRPTSATQSSSPSSDDGLSSGAIAGIVIGVVAIIAIIAGIIVFVIINRRRNAAAAANMTNQADQNHEKRPLDYYGTPGPYNSGEVYAKVAQEEPYQHPQELPAPHRPQELP